MAEQQGWVRVASAGDIPAGQGIAVKLGDREVAIFHVEGGGFFATDNVCTHEYAQLHEGWLEGHEIECPLHAGRFDIRTGKALCAPVEEDVKTYELKMSGNDILLKAP